MDKIEIKAEKKVIEKGKIETTRNMKEDGFSLAKIIHLTGLNKQQLKDAGVF